MTTQRELPVLRVVDGNSLRRRLARKEIHEISDLVSDLFAGRSVVITQQAWDAAVRLGGAARHLGMTEDSRARALGYQAWCALKRTGSEAANFAAEVITDHAWAQKIHFQVQRDPEATTITTKPCK